MNKTIKTIKLVPAQGVQTELGKMFLYNASAVNRVIEQINTSEAEILKNVTAAQESVNSANEFAKSAKASAENAQSQKIAAENAATNAKIDSENARVSAQQAIDAQEFVQGSIDSIQSAVDTAVSSAESAKSSADSAAVSAASAAEMARRAGLKLSVVMVLPEVGDDKTIYLVPKDGAAPDVHDEYVWIESTQTFELIGTTQVDLSNYVKNTDYAAYKNGADRAGVIKVSGVLGTSTSSDGYIIATTRTLDQYNSGKASCIIGKGTLENVKDDYVKRGITENTIALTEEEKTAAKNWLGVVGDTDYGTASKGGVIKSNTSYCFSINPNNGIPSCVAIKNIDTYNSRYDEMFVSKGTLETIKNDLVKRAVTANDIELTDDEKTSARTWLGAVGDTDYASFTKAGVFKADNGVVVTAKGVIAGSEVSLENYQNKAYYLIISKGTLENIKDDYVKRGITENATALTDEEKAAAQAWLGVSGGGDDVLPDQTGNAGKFLMTNGSTASWGGGKIDEYSVAIGSSSSAYSNGIALGTSAKSNSIGAIALGSKTSAELLATAIGCNAKATAKNAIQLGSASSYVSGHTNSDANTFKVGNANGNFEMMSANGTIPADRMSATAGITGQVLTKTDDGMAWQDASGGYGDIDCGVMS